jgi:hypothetical protein
LGGSSSLFADYELFVTYTKPLSSIKSVKKTVEFTGKYSDYQKQFNASAKKYANNGMIVSTFWEMHMDEQFIRVEKIEDAKGNFTLKRTLMVGDKKPSYSVEQANQIMARGK